MVFSSLTFLFVFLPIVFILYSIIPSLKIKNVLLVVASLLFYAYGEPVYVLLMIASTFLNYIFGLFVSRGDEKFRKIALVISVLLNLGIIGFFKYIDMFIGALNRLPAIELPLVHVALPIGISFFTFQAMSYVIDVYRKDVNVEKSYFNVLLYISFFPQLIAGPIVKFHDIAEQINKRKQSIPEVAEGLRRFCVGLAKKVLIANQCAVVCDAIFKAVPSELNIISAWLGAFAYMLQIYFDFSGYSDMAIGLGHMFGFTFKENFNYPYKSKSIQEFWRRWHISLSTWFLEYLYIPLGGNRKGKLRTVFNKITVFFLCGLWHGASWTFVFWGLYHGFFLLLEEYIPRLRKLPSFFAHAYALIIVLLGWVLFRADSFSQAASFYQLMFTGFNFSFNTLVFITNLISPQFVLAIAVGALASFPMSKLIESYLGENGSPLVKSFTYICSVGLLIICILQISSGAYSPFIYFRF